MTLDDLYDLSNTKDKTLSDAVFDDLPNDDDLLNELVKTKVGRPKKNNEDMLDLAEKQLMRILKGKSTTPTDRLRAVGMAVKFREIKAGLHTQAITEPIMRLLDFLLDAEHKLRISGEDAIKILTNNKEEFFPDISEK